MEDYSNVHPGAYSLSLLDITSGPLTSGADPDGGILQPGDLKLGQFQTVPDFDGFRFDGAFGDTVRITTAATSGPVVPLFAIYPPTGQSLLTTTQANVTYVLPSRSIFTLVIQDQTLSNTGSYSIHFQKTGGITGVPDGARPAALALDPAVPNPFMGSTDVGFSLQSEGPVTLRVFDVRGARVATLADGRFAAGHHDARWDGRDARGGRAPSGIYWAELRASNSMLRRRLVRVQ